MTVKSIFLAAGTLAILATTSCKKDDNNGGSSTNTAPSASTLTAGNCYIAFTTDKAVYGTSNYVYKSAIPYDQTQAVLSSNTASLQGIHTEVSGTTAKAISASIQISTVKVGSYNFSQPEVNFALLYNDGTVTNGDGYVMESGTLEVTKFSNNELEGKFSGKAINDKNDNVTISNGTFAAKF